MAATGALGSVVGWLVNTLASALIGLVVGAAVVVVMSRTLHRRKARPASATGTQ
jgi:predicted DNA repair protein MutK